MKKIKILIENGEPKFLFVSLDRSQAAIVTMEGVAMSGIPISTEGDYEGQDMVYSGKVSDDYQLGYVNLKMFQLPK